MNKMTVHPVLAGIAATASLAVALTGCGSVDDQAPESELDQVELAEIMELLSTGETTCGEAAADKTYDKVFPAHPGFTAPSTYAAGKNGCGAAYFVDVTDYRTGNTTKTNVIRWAGTQPTTKAACEALNVRVYVFNVDDVNDAEYIDWDISKGQWFQLFDEDGTVVGEHCITPFIYIERKTDQGPLNFNLPTGHDYKFAISARDIAPDPDVMKPFAVSSQNIAHIH